MNESFFGGSLFRIIGVTAVAMCLATTNVRHSFAQEATPPQWTDTERKQMRQALLAMKQKQYQDALPLLLPLYEKAPYQVEKFEANDILKKGAFTLPSGTLLDYKASDLLFNTLFYTKQYPKALAVSSASLYHDNKVTIPTVSNYLLDLLQEKKKGVKYSPAVTINDSWINPEQEPVLRDDTVFAPLVDLARALDLKPIPQAGKSLVVLRQKQPSLQLVFKVGDTQVKVGKNIKARLKYAPYRRGSEIMVSVRDFASVLKGEVHWFPEIMFMHVIFPKTQLRSSFLTSLSVSSVAGELGH